MALTTAALTRPAGRLSAAWFGAAFDLDAALTTWLSQATDATTDEEAQAAYVYWRAYEALADDRMMEPAQQSVGIKSDAYTDVSDRVVRGPGRDLRAALPRADRRHGRRRGAAGGWVHHHMTGTRHYTDPLTVIRDGTPTRVTDPDTGESIVEAMTTEPWNGYGTLQPNLGGKPAVVADGQGAVREVPVPYIAVLPDDAAVLRGDRIRDADGRMYQQVAPPVNPGGYWLLNLGPVTS